ncbi:MAG TPA: hypothetical protein VLZ72_03795 [Flavobacterium sp.]|nr:hypothetical protein [Flavobacterium sp.]
MPNTVQYYLQVSLTLGLIVICTLHFSRTISFAAAILGKAVKSIQFFLQSSLIQSKYSVQNWMCSNKLLQYSQEALKSISNNLKSPQKDEKALPKLLQRLHFRAFSRLFTLYLPLNLNLYDIP